MNFKTFIGFFLVGTALLSQIILPNPFIVSRQVTNPLMVEGSTQSFIEFRYGGSIRGYYGACLTGTCILNNQGNIGFIIPFNTQNVVMTSGDVQMLHPTTATNCVNNASPAVCSVATAGVVAMAAGSSTLQVNTTQVRANSQIIITPDSSLGTALSVTCNTTIPTISVSARTASTSFVITASAAPATNPLCMSYMIIN
jgi:hypothetical protein